MLGSLKERLELTLNTGVGNIETFQSEARKKLDFMMCTEPENCSETARDMFRRLRELKTEYFEANKADRRMVLDGQADYEVWQENKIKYEGSRHRQTRKPHGLVRRCNGESIQTAQFKDGILSGLYVKLDEDGYLYFKMFNDGSKRAEFSIQPDGTEYKTGDEQFCTQLRTLYEKLISAKD